jgi:MSHA biogenesis protein MshJ
VKQRWRVLAARIDVLTLRQRVGLFAACAAFVLYLVYMLALEPMLHEQARLHAQMSQQRAAMAGLDTDITVLVEAFARDPDAANRQRLAAARDASLGLTDKLAAMQKGLVAPEQVAPLLEAILRANGKLQLVALATLPVTPVGGPAAPGAAPVAAASATPSAAASSAPAASAAPAMSGLLYRHGVQVTVRGSYLDMVDYMAALESLPAQLFWGDATFDVEDYPRAHVTLTLYTLSLDRKWLRI